MAPKQDWFMSRFNPNIILMSDQEIAWTGRHRVRKEKNARMKIKTKCVPNQLKVQQTKANKFGPPEKERKEEMSGRGKRVQWFTFPSLVF